MPDGAAALPHPRLLWVYGSIAAIVVLAWGAAFLSPESMFWDDWVVVNDDTLRMTREMGLPWIGYVFTGLFALGPWAFKALVLVATTVIGCASYQIAGRGLGLSTRERWLLAFLIVSLPLFSSRMIVVLSTYSWSLALFFIAWYLLVRSAPERGGRWRFVAAAILFFVSYTTASLLPLTALPVAHLAFLSLGNRGARKADVLRFVGRYWYLLATPVVFWIVRTIFLMPYGLYENYNQISLLNPTSRLFLIGTVVLFVAIVVSGLVLAIWYFARAHAPSRLLTTLSIAALVTTALVLCAFLEFGKVSSVAIAHVVPACLVAGALALLVAALHAVRQARRGGGKPSSELSGVVAVLSVGILTLALGMFPYLVVGKLPSFATWETRHQLLMPLGTAIILLAVLRAFRPLVPALAVRIVSIALVSVFVASSLVVSVSMAADWRKQMQISDALQNEPLVRAASTVVFSDLARDLNFDARGYSLYEFTGWMWTAYGDQSRLGIDRPQVSSFVNGELDGLYYAASRYGFGDYSPSTDGVLVEILPVEGSSWLTLLGGQQSITLRVTPIPNLSTFR